jgi:hypothetical protein
MPANLTTRALDHRLSLLAQMEGWTYTRYAGDLAFFRSGKASRIAAMGLPRRVAYELKVAGLIHHREMTSVVPPGARKVLLGVLVDRERPRLTRAFRNNIETHLFALTSDKIGPAAHRQKRGAYDPARFASAPCSAPSAISLQPIAGSAANHSTSDVFARVPPIPGIPRKYRGSLRQVSGVALLADTVASHDRCDAMNRASGSIQTLRTHYANKFGDAQLKGADKQVLYMWNPPALETWGGSQWPPHLFDRSRRNDLHYWEFPRQWGLTFGENLCAHY